MAEFAFWPSSPPKQHGGIYELRSYQLIPGRLREWEHQWKRGLEARRKFVVSLKERTHELNYKRRAFIYYCLSLLSATCWWLVCASRQSSRSPSSVAGEYQPVFAWDSM